MKTFTFECGSVAEEDEDLTVTGIDEVGGCAVIGEVGDDCEDLLEAECDEVYVCGCGCC
jgi:hypothetical protein